MIFDVVVQGISEITNSVYATTAAEYITPLANDLGDTIGSILPSIFAVAILLFSVLLGWRLLKRFTGGR